jgi:hypothetical protein
MLEKFEFFEKRHKLYWTFTRHTREKRNPQKLFLRKVRDKIKNTLTSEKNLNGRQIQNGSKNKFFL